MLAVIDSKEGVACEKVSHFEDRASEFDGLCVDSNDILYVTEWYNNSCVCMFTTGGEFLGYVGGGSRFKYPTFITSDQSGRLYISDDNGVTICKCYQ